MKKIPCPKCQSYIAFDETKYHDGQSLVFTCPDCNKQFSIRIGKTHLYKQRMAEDILDEKEAERGSIMIIANAFCYKQEFPLEMGDNVIGCKATNNDVNIPIETSDPSMDRHHCVINIKKNKKGKLIYTLRDNPSITGTFIMNDILQDNELRILHNEDIITIGATTFIINITES